VGRDRPSNEDAPRVPGEERSGPSLTCLFLVLRQAGANGS
jgi:hypothetical protein